MSMPYNLRYKINRDLSNDPPRISVYHSSSSSCSSSQSSQSPSPINFNLPINEKPPNILFTKELEFGTDESDSISDSNTYDDYEEFYIKNTKTQNSNEESIIMDINKTLIEFDRSNNETIINCSSASPNWFSITNSISKKQQCSRITTRSRSRNTHLDKITLTHSNRTRSYQPSVRISNSEVEKMSSTSTILTRSAQQQQILIQQQELQRTMVYQTRTATSRSLNRSKLPISNLTSSLLKIGNENDSNLLNKNHKNVQNIQRSGLEILKNDDNGLNTQPSMMMTRERKNSSNSCNVKLLKKKRISTTSNACTVPDDNDHDEDSSDDIKSSNQLIKIANTVRTSRVSFSLNMNNNEPKSLPGKKRTGRTPPHKKFRKLRLFDTPQTPKTLLKKAQPIPNDSVVSNTLDSTMNTSSKKAVNKKLLTANEVIKAVVGKGSPIIPKPVQKKAIPVQASSTVQNLKPNLKPIINKPVPIIKPQDPQYIVQSTKNDYNTDKIEEDLSMSSPPHNQNFKSTCVFNTIHDTVHQTPKSVRRATPGNLLKAPVPCNPNESPEYKDMNNMMDVDCQLVLDTKPPQIPETLRLMNSAFKPNLNNIQNSAHARRLFDFNSNGSDMSCVVQNTMNKKLQFDDSDSEDNVNHNVLHNNQPKCLSFESEDIHVVGHQSVSPVSSTSSWCSGANTQNMPQHLVKLKALSNSSNSLFKPISRFINQNHLGNFNNQNLSGSNHLGLSNSSSAGLNSLRSPGFNSPFHALHANINPFTPTNNSNSLSTHNKNSRNIITNNVNSSSHHQTNLINVNTNISMPEISIQKEFKQQGSTKRCFNETNSNNFNINRNLNTHPSNAENETEIDIDNNSNDTHIQISESDNNHCQTSAQPKNKRLALRQCLVSRYHEEFHEVCKLGNGEFGDVFKCINRLDGCTYAIKRSNKPIAGSALEMTAWKEVCAHAVLVKHSHIVQYYSAWAEADRMLIQNEYCNGGSLAEFIETLRVNNLSNVNNNNNSEQQNLQISNGRQQLQNSSLMNEYDLKLLLLHIAKGLSYMHSLNLVHLDIKPGNIFICRAPRKHHITHSDQVTTQSDNIMLNEESGIESEGFDDDDAYALTISNKTKQSSDQSGSGNSIFSDVITYKIGDLGHVTSTLDPHVEEGDCRYLPNEILQEQYDMLPKADVFALALTVFVCGTLEELPKNGDEWHWIRQGNFKDIPQCNDKFKKLLTQMIDENPNERPSASTLIHHPCIVPDASKSKSQLRKELNQEKFKNEMLKRKVKLYEQQMLQNNNNCNSNSNSIENSHINDGTRNLKNNISNKNNFPFSNNYKKNLDFKNSNNNDSNKNNLNILSTKFSRSISSTLL